MVCHAITTYVRNCYSIPSRLFVIGWFEIKSCEGTTQGDPIVMCNGSLCNSHNTSNVNVTWNNTKKYWRLVAYANDFTAAGSIASLKYLWDTLYKIEPTFGYFPQASKTWLIVKSNYLTKATEVFTNNKIQITSSGKRHLGAVIGTTNYKEEYINEKIIIWLSEIRMLGQIVNHNLHTSALLLD